MSKRSDFLKRVFLDDPETGRRGRIKAIDCGEEGGDHFTIFVQNPDQRGEGLCWKFTVHQEECDVSEIPSLSR